MALNPQNIFAPYIDGPGLSVTISPATALIAGVVTSFPLTAVTVIANQTTYIFADMAGGVISANNSGFPISNTYPIAIAVSALDRITSLVDSRPDIFSLSASSGGNSVQSVMSTQAVTFAGGFNTLIEATAATNVTLTLPSPVGFSGRTITVKKVDTGTGFVTIHTAAGLIEGISSYVLGNQWQFASLQSDGTSWLIVANN